jgi:DNA-binding NtrC family response regulator
MTRILVVDDETKLLRLIEELFGEQGYQVQTATRAEKARELLASGLFDLLVTDVRLPGHSGMELLRWALDLQPEIQVIVITAYGSVSGAVEAMRLGAFDYLLKPFDLEGLLLIAERALETSRLKSENLYLRAQLEGGASLGVSSSPTPMP